MTLCAQPPPKPAKPEVPKPAAAKPSKPATPSKPEVLTNDSIIRMMSAGLDEDTILAKIKSTPAAFLLDTNELIRLKEAKISQRVLRAMLGKQPDTTEPQRPAEQIVKEPGPAVPVMIAAVKLLISSPLWPTSC